MDIGDSQTALQILPQLRVGLQEVGALQTVGEGLSTAQIIWLEIQCLAKTSDRFAPFFLAAQYGSEIDMQRGVTRLDDQGAIQERRGFVVAALVGADQGKIVQALGVLGIKFQLRFRFGHNCGFEFGFSFRFG